MSKVCELEISLSPRSPSKSRTNTGPKHPDCQINTYQQPPLPHPPRESSRTVPPGAPRHSGAPLRDFATLPVAAESPGEDPPRPRRRGTTSSVQDFMRSVGRERTAERGLCAVLGRRGGVGSGLLNGFDKGATTCLAKSAPGS